MAITRMLRQNKALYNLALSAAFLNKVSWSKITGGRKLFPKVVQLPVTYNCNSKCVMCNIWRMDYSNEMSLEEFSRFMKDPIFSRVEAVGINGGEPSLVKGLDLFALDILKLPRLKALNIISHGFNRKQLFPFLESTYAACRKAGVSFHVSISLDGFGEIHNAARGLNVFELTSATIRDIHENMDKYCDSYDIGCTVIRQNVDHLVELDVFARRNGYNIKYRMGIENKRIESNKLIHQFSLLHDWPSQGAQEFFHSLISRAATLRDRFKYFAIFYFLSAKKRMRLLGCYWKEEGITMDSRGDLYYCAVESEKIGSLREKGGKEIFFDPANIAYRRSIIENKCDSCIHDYSGKPEAAGVLTFFRQMLTGRYYWLAYYLKARFA